MCTIHVSANACRISHSGHKFLPQDELLYMHYTKSRSQAFYTTPLVFDRLQYAKMSTASDQKLEA